MYIFRPFLSCFVFNLKHAEGKCALALVYSPFPIELHFRVFVPSAALDHVKGILNVYTKHCLFNQNFIMNH